MENNTQLNANGKLLIDDRTNFDIVDSALACIMFITLSIIFSVCLKVFGIKVYSGSFGYFILQAVAEIVFAAAAMAVVWLKKRNIVEDAGMKNKVNKAMVGWCFLASLISLFGFSNLTNVFLEFLGLLGYSSILGSMSVNTFAQYIGYIISSCAIAAFCEELLFRGVILSGFRKYGMKIAVFFSALIFMLMHGNAEQTVHQFIIGLVVGYAFYMTNNLWIGVLIHAFNNFIPITESFLLSIFASSSATETAETAEEVATTATNAWGTLVVELIIAIIVAWAGLYFLKIIMAHILKENEKLNGKANETVTSIVVDGDEQNVEMSIDGAPVETSTEQYSAETILHKKPNIPAAAIVMFTLAGLYLIGNWIVYTLAGFML